MFQRIFGGTKMEMAEAMLYEIWSRQPNEEGVNAAIHYVRFPQLNTVSVQFILHKK